ncbi:MAG: DUF998 domain-containing protein [Pseudonocardia sp.]
MTSGLSGRSRRTRVDHEWFGVAAAGGVVSFWLLALVAGALAPGYSVRDDYTSSLAGRGSSVAVLGIAALAVLGLAHLAAAASVRGVVAVPLALAGVAGVIVAAFRVGCPGGAAGCSVGANDPPADLADLVHGFAVGGYEIALVVAMMMITVSGGRRWNRGFRVLTVVAAVASVLLLLQTGGADNGLWQRGWLVVNSGWLVAVAVAHRR